MSEQYTPEVFMVGQKKEQFLLGPDDCFLFDMQNKDNFVILYNMPNPDYANLASFHAATKITLAVKYIEPIIFVCVRVGDMPWGDANYNAFGTLYSRRVNRDDLEHLNPEKINFSLFLADGLTGMLHGIKMFRAENNVLNELDRFYSETAGLWSDQRIPVDGTDTGSIPPVPQNN